MRPPFGISAVLTVSSPSSGFCTASAANIQPPQPLVGAFCVEAARFQVPAVFIIKIMSFCRMDLVPILEQLVAVAVRSVAPKWIDWSS